MNGAMLERGRALSAKDFVAAVHDMERYARRASAWTTRFDLLLTPTSPVPPPPLGVNSPIPDTAHPEYDPGAPAAFTVPFDVTGEPAISLPLGWSTNGLPLGSQLVAPYGREDVLLRVAAQVEVAQPWAGVHPAS
jgi:amidase